MHIAIISIFFAVGFSLIAISAIMFGSNTFIGLPSQLLTVAYIAVILGTVLYSALYARNPNVTIPLRTVPLNAKIMIMSLMTTLTAIATFLATFALIERLPPPKFIIIGLGALLLANLSLMLNEAFISRETTTEADQSEKPDSATQETAPTE